VTEVSIRTRARAHIHAELVASDDVADQQAHAASAVDALSAMGEGLFEPLAMNVELACCDAESGYPLDEPRPARRFHQLRLASVPEEVRIPRIWKELQVSERERLDPATVLGWFGTILADPGCTEPHTTLGWTDLIIEAVRARLPATINSTGNELPVAYGAGVIRYPVERFADALWVAGPLSWNSDTAPFEVAIVNEGGVLSLDWTQAWSPWIEEDGAGRPDLEGAIRRLSAMGWDIRAADPA
jgi:hypothetical protein